MRDYNNPSGGKGLFQNYPYNDLRGDPYLTEDKSLIDTGDTNGNTACLGGCSNTIGAQIQFDKFSFHSPDTSSQHPYLGNPELKFYLYMFLIVHTNYYYLYLSLNYQNLCCPHL